MERAQGESQPIGATSRRSPSRIGTGAIVARIGCPVRNAMCDAGSACGRDSCTSAARQIRCDGHVVIAHRRLLDALPDASLHASFLHQPNRPFATDARVLLEEVLVNPWAAVALLTGVERGV